MNTQKKMQGVDKLSIFSSSSGSEQTNTKPGWFTALWGQTPKPKPKGPTDIELGDVTKSTSSGISGLWSGWQSQEISSSS